MTQRFHSFEKNDFSLGGLPINEFSEDGGVEYTFDADLLAASVGADGVVSFSRNKNDLLMMDITVKETGLGYRRLGDLLKAQEAAMDSDTNPRLPRLAYIHRDPINGDVVTGSAVFMTRATPSKAREAGDRVFRLALAQGGARINYGALINPAP